MTRVLVAAAQPQIDYAKLDIKTTDLGQGVYLLGWQGGDSYQSLKGR